MTIREMAIRHYNECDPALREAGLAWYGQSLNDVDELARLLPHGVGRSAAAGILAALSPQTQWASNWKFARTIVTHAGAQEMPAIGGFPKNREKAWRIANGERPAEVLGGPKVRAFWRALAGDPDAVVLDLWMFRAFDLPDAPTRKVYDRVALELKAAADELGVAARDLQAVIWLHMRGIKPSDPDAYFPSGKTATLETA
jgi:hypothetical protein